MGPQLTLYTIDRCIYCYMLKEKLDEWGVSYYEINHEGAKTYTMYPQLFNGDKDVLLSDTSGLTKQLLSDRIYGWDNQTECDFGKTSRDESIRVSQCY